MGKGRDSSDTNAKMTLCVSTITAFFALVVLIISLGITPTYDYAAYKKCGNSGAFKTDCSVTDWRRLATKVLSTKVTERNLAAFESANPTIATNEWLPAAFDLKTVMAKVTGPLYSKTNFAKKNKKKQPTRLLGSHVAKNSDDCATANNFLCEDDQKKVYNEYASDTCALNTDTSDCKGILEGSNCVKGECCCSKKAKAAMKVGTKFEVEAKAAWSKSYKSDIEDATGENDYGYYEGESKYESCNACSQKYPKECLNSYSCDGQFIDSDWDAPPFVEKGCGYTKEQVCDDANQASEQAASDQLWGALQNWALYATLLIIVGALPAVVSAAGKLKSQDGVGALEQGCGTLSIFSTIFCGVCGGGALAAMMLVGAALLSAACQGLEDDNVAYEAELDKMCTPDCMAVRNIDIETICKAGGTLGLTSTLLLLCCFFSVVTSILVCIGFCNKKNKVQQQVVVVQQVPVQQVMPVQQAVVVK